MSRLLALVMATGLLCAACGGGAAPGAASGAPADVPALVKDDRTVGTGAEAIPGRTVTVHYTGWLYDPSAPEMRGKKFDSSKDRNEPFEFQLGKGDVIAGWDEGVAGMRVGGTRVLTIPSAMGYGPRGAGSDIPPNAALVFEVELLGAS
ncbi:MAG: FKBP-type peptidyl-prolyl cis-trans isomerase [Vicinamibacterales bacterium]